jgi:hypothetical protein
VSGHTKCGLRLITYSWASPGAREIEPWNNFRMLELLVRNSTAVNIWQWHVSKSTYNSVILAVFNIIMGNIHQSESEVGCTLFATVSEISLPA